MVDAPSEERTPRFDPDAADAIKTLVRACVIIALSVGGFVVILYRLYWPY